MKIEEPSAEVIASVEGAVQWLGKVQMTGWRTDEVKNADGRRERRLIADPKAPPLWARFYELKTDRPLYLDRDSEFGYDYNAISYERRSGYTYHGTWAQSILDKEYPRWCAKHHL